MQKNLFSLFISLFVIVLFLGCQSSKTAVVTPETLGADELEVYNLFKDVEKNWAMKNFDGVFKHYAEDGVFTGKNNTPASKNDLLKLCQETGDTWKISKVDLKKLSVDGEKAYAEAVLKIKFDGGGKNHKENYELEKRNGTWLVVKEINP
ncbi:MAG: hypothetical protein MI892_26850 [Desulfobacterales bacterium]|nr:hypothetical protein [Desulfobacterales bacterium]